MKRIVRSKVHAQHSPCVEESVLHGQPRGSYRKWNDKSMQKAAKAVEEGIFIHKIIISFAYSLRLQRISSIVFYGLYTVKLENLGFADFMFCLRLKSTKF